MAAYAFSMTWLKAHEGGTLLHLTLQPNSSKNEIIGILGDRLKLKITAPPVDGAANEELINFLAQYLAVPRSKLKLYRGEKSRKKDVWINRTVGEIKKGPLGALFEN